MHLPPRLSAEQARTMAVQFKDSDAQPRYATPFSPRVLSVYREACNKRPDIWLGVFVWPDGAAAMLPVPPEGMTLPDHLAEFYELWRNIYELQVLHALETSTHLPRKYQQ